LLHNEKIQITVNKTRRPNYDFTLRKDNLLKVIGKFFSFSITIPKDLEHLFIKKGKKK